MKVSSLFTNNHYLIIACSVCNQKYEKKKDNNKSLSAKFSTHVTSRSTYVFLTALYVKSISNYYQILKALHNTYRIFIRLVANYKSIHLEMNSFCWILLNSFMYVCISMNFFILVLVELIKIFQK